MEEKRILLVEDDEEEALNLKTVLENSGYAVTLADNGERAYKLYRAFTGYLVLTDINMPGMSGLELLKKIREISEDAVVILITGYSELEKTRDAVHYGAFDYLVKPLEKASLLKSVDKAFDKYKGSHEKRRYQEELQQNVDDISKTLQIQKEALQREQERTRGIIEAAHIGFLVLDGESEEVYLLNKRGRELLLSKPCREEDYFLKNYCEIFPDNIVEIIKKLILRIQTEKSVINGGILSLTEGPVLDFVGYPILMEDRISSIVIVVEDITEKQVLEKQILQSSRLADIGELAAVVGHEINNPIAFITSNTHSLEKYLKKIQEFAAKIDEIEAFFSEIEIDEAKILDIYQGVLSLNEKIQGKKEEISALKKQLKIKSALSSMEEIIRENLEGLDRIKKIVLDLKTLSYMGEEKIEEADINKVIQNTIDMVWNQLKYKVEVVRRFGSIPLLRCYPRQISQVFTNIIVNAAQAIHKKGTITIRTWYENQAVNIEISDTGCGMDESVQKKLFNPFFTTKKIGKGTGLGLSISYKIISKHQGTITVKSEPAKGSTFIIRLPLAGMKENEEKG
ncbi:MAG: response regulator [Candidatus Aureabacteria bacterium]|nr:response regulator [Candidatus Auribacterota bacterium]